MTPHTVEPRYIQFSGTSGYARHGDMVALFADRIDNLSGEDTPGGNLSLQLWACQSPYSGGELTGWKLAEAAVGVLQPGQCLASLRYDVPASFPEAGDFAMTLVIAEWDGQGFNRIHDFHNYPHRDVFIHPRLEGRIGYRFVDDEHLFVDVERIHNPREPDNLSGTLSLELWALPGPYVGGDFHGYAVGGITLGTLAGDAGWQNTSYELAIARPPPGSYTLVLMLREWTGNVYVTRDHCNFARPVTFPLVPSANQAEDTRDTGGPETQATSSTEPQAQSGETRSAQDGAKAAVEPAAPVPQGAAQTPAQRSGQNPPRLERMKQSAQRAWVWVKQHW